MVLSMGTMSRQQTPNVKTRFLSNLVVGSVICSASIISLGLVMCPFNLNIIIPKGTRRQTMEGTITL